VDGQAVEIHQMHQMIEELRAKHVNMQRQVSRRYVVAVVAMLDVFPRWTTAHWPGSHMDALA